MSYYTKIAAGAVGLALMAFLTIWYLTSSAFAGHSPGIGTRLALGVLIAGGGFVTGGLLTAVFAEKEEEDEQQPHSAH